MLDIGLYLFYALMGIAILVAIGFAIYHAIKTPGALVKTLIALGALAVLFGVSYALSSGELSNSNRALGVTEGTSKLIGAGLIMFYVAFALAILALIYSEITKAAK